LTPRHPTHKKRLINQPRGAERKLKPATYHGEARPSRGQRCQVNLPDGEMFWGVRADSLSSTGRADLETSKRRDADQRKH